LASGQVAKSRLEGEKSPRRLTLWPSFGPPLTFRSSYATLIKHPVAKSPTNFSRRRKPEIPEPDFHFQFD